MDGSTLQILGLGLDVVGFLCIAIDVTLSHRIDVADRKLREVQHTLLRLTPLQEQLDHVESEAIVAKQEFETEDKAIDERASKYDMSHGPEGYWYITEERDELYSRYLEINRKALLIRESMKDISHKPFSLLENERNEYQRVVDEGRGHNWDLRVSYFQFGCCLVITGFICQIIGIAIS